MYSNGTEIKLVTGSEVFGDGNHESTQNVLDALFQANPSGKDVLDIGTGTGVQAIFAKKWGANRVVAVDISYPAILTARQNFQRNNVEIESRLNIYNEYLDFKADIIVANLSPHEVREFLPLAQSSLKDNGILICSWMNPADINNECDLSHYTILSHIPGIKWDAYVLGKKE